MKIKAGILTILLSMPVFLFGQNWSHVDSIAFDALSERAEDAAYASPELAYATFDTLINLSQKAEFPYAFLYGLVRKAQAAVYFHDFDKAELFLEEAKPHFEKYEGKMDGSDSYILPMLATTQLYYLNDLGQDEKLISLSSSLIEKINNGFGGDYREYHLIPTIMYKAVALKKTGRLEEAQAALLDGVELAIKLDDADLKHFYKHLGDVYALKGERHQAKEFYQRALSENIEAYQNNQSNRLASRIVSIYSAMATLFEESNLDSARYYLDQADPFLARDPFLIVEHSLSKIDLSIKGQEIQEANNQLLQLLDLIQVDRKGPDPKYARILLYQASILKHQNQFELALEKIETALSKNSGIILKESTGEFPAQNDFIDQKLGSELLLLKSKLALALGDLELAESAIHDAMDIVLYFKSSILTEEDRNYLLTSSKPIIEQAIQLCLQHQMNGTDSKLSAMYLIENAKAINLLGAMRTQDAAVTDHFPKELISEERKIREELESLQSKLISKSALSSDDPDIIKMNALRSRQNEKLEQLAQLGREEEFVSRFKVDIDIDALVKKKLLTSNRSMLHFFYGDKTIYALHTSQKNQKLYVIENGAIVNNWISVIRSQVTTEDLTESGADALRDLCTSLIGPIEDQMTEQMIIVPDGQLFYLPFEMLIQGNNGTTSTPHYLVETCEISYTYSASVLAEMNKRSNAAETRSVLAFAPQFTSPFADASINNRGSFANLPFSQKEIESIETHLPVEAYLGDAATEETFLEQARNHSILHLATHAAAIDNPSSRSYLAFSGSSPNLDTGLLFLSELTQLPLQAELVTLSACETGLGKLQGGEGVISLARGFQYAGANALLTSLWKVNDEMTANLMALFYKHLSDGKSKSRALQLAKINMLTTSNLSNRNPLYWAGFVLIGDPSPISYLSSGFPWSFLPIAISIIIVITVFRRRTAKGNQKRNN